MAQAQRPCSTPHAVPTGGYTPRRDFWDAGAYFERRAAILGHPYELPPPANAAAIDEAERRLGRRLPADPRTLYMIADGDGDGDGDADADATLDDALAWAARLGLDTENALRTTGTLKTLGG